MTQKSGLLVTLTVFPLGISVGLSGALLWPHPALAQSITPSGSGTQVESSGAGHTITEGSPSADGSNLFHSFEQFGLSAGEWANFIADPAVQNILGRITGDDASLIDGTLQVTRLIRILCKQSKRNSLAFPPGVSPQHRVTILTATDRDSSIKPVPYQIKNEWAYPLCLGQDYWRKRR